MTGSALALAPWNDPCPQLRALSALVSDRLTELGPQPNRNQPNQERYECALTALCAVIAIVATARVTDGEGYPVSFSNDHYAGGPISVEHLRQLRDGLVQSRLIRYVGGFHDRSGAGNGRVSRFHPTAAFSGLIARSGLRPCHLARVAHGLIVIRNAGPVLPEPPEVHSSRAILERLNAVNATSTLALPEESWERIARRWAEGEDEEETGRPRFRGINEAYLSLRRSFSGGWGRGGRLYGGFWQVVPKAERGLFLIDGEPTTELDYRALHPRILYSERGAELTDDPYTITGFEVSRDYGKRTFNRLLNSEWNGRRSRHPLHFRPEDHLAFASRSDFRRYVDAFRAKHAAIADAFGTGDGVRLQCRDSELALEVIDRFLSAGQSIFPIHDSFIVKKTHEEKLRNIMMESSRKMLGVLVPVSG